MTVPTPHVHRVLYKGQWESEGLCGGLASPDNPQICIPLPALSEEGGSRTHSARVTLSVPLLYDQRGFSALLGLSVYYVPASTPLDDLYATSRLGDGGEWMPWDSTSDHVGVGTGMFSVTVDILCGSDSVAAVVIIPEISPPKGGEGGLNAPYAMLLQASFPLAPRRLERPPKPAVSASASAGRFRLSAASEIARVKEKREQQEKAKLQAKASLAAFGLRERARAMSAASAATSGISMPSDGHIPYALLPHLTPELGYPPGDSLRAASMGVKSRSTPGISIAVSHVVAGLGDEERSLALLRTSSGTCFVPLHSTVSVAWDFVPGEIPALGNHREKHWRDMLLLMSTDQPADDVDCAGGCSVQLDLKMPQDEIEVALPEELEFGVTYEFRYFAFNPRSVHGDFTGFRSQPFRVVPRAGVDTDGWIAIMSEAEEDTTSGVLRVAQGVDVRVEWEISDLAGITQESREYFLENGTKNYEDFIAVYDINEPDVDNYAYYFDVPEAEEDEDEDDGDGSGSDAPPRPPRPAPTTMNLEWYYLENYCAEPGVTYVIRYIREKVAVAQSFPFVVPVPADE